MKEKVFKRIEAIKKAMKNDKGFTLVELIVTVTIIGILSAVVTTGVSGAASTSQTKANQAFFGSVQSGVDTYAASTPAAVGVPLTSTVITASMAGYYQVNGSTAYTTLTTDKEIDFTGAGAGGNPDPTFATFFRLNNSSATRSCLVGNSTSFTVKACHN